MHRSELKTQVKNILDWCPYTRNSDIDLWVEIIKSFYWPEWLSLLHRVQSWDSTDRDSVKQMSSLKEFMHEVPNQDNVKRLRADFNSKGKFLPTSPMVAKARKFNQEWWKKQLGYEGLVPSDHLEINRQEQHIRSINQEGREQGKLLNVRPSAI